MDYPGSTHNVRTQVGDDWDIDRNVALWASASGFNINYSEPQT